MSIPYILYTAILITLFYSLYHLLLSKETFFGINRYILVFGIICSFIIPAIPTPIKITVADTLIESDVIFFKEINVFGEQVMINSSDIPQSTEVLPLDNQVSLQTAKSKKDVKILPLIYFIGVSILLINFFIQLAKILYTIIRYNKGGSIVKLPFERSPSSFFNYVFIGENTYNTKSFNHILTHEKIHSKQKHTIDILLAEILIIIQWFNPFAWFYRRALEGNLEFIVDNEMLNVVESKKEYQYNLLNLAVKNKPLSVVTNYNQSLIKTRITMMNTKKSSLRQSWKYLLLIPFLFLSVFIFNPSALPPSQHDERPSYLGVFISANSTKEDLQRIQTELTSLDYSLKFSDLIWDENGFIEKITTHFSFGDNSLSNTINYNDINRQSLVNLYHFKDGIGGLFTEGGVKENGETLGFVENLNIIDFNAAIDSIFIISTFTDRMMPAMEFISSNEWQNQLSVFSKEKNWSLTFSQDLEQGTESFNYFMNDVKTSITQLQLLIQHKKIRTIEITENSGTKSDFKLYAESYSGYQMISSSSYPKLKNNFIKYVQTTKESLQIAKNEHPNSVVKYFYNGLPTNVNLDNVDSTFFNFIKIEKGINFNIKGDFLNNEIHLNFIK